MAKIVVVGAGIGGISQAYELRKMLGKEHAVVLIGDSERFEFTPSNPWVAVGWRTEQQTTIELPDLMQKHGIEFFSQGVRRLIPAENRLELNDGVVIDYDYVVLATGPKLAFDEVDGLGPDKGFTQSICKTGHASTALDDVQKLLRTPGPVIIGAAPGASCFGPAYEYAFILDTELKKRKIRDRVPMHFVTPEPYIGHLGLDGVGDTKSLMESEFRDRHIHWTCNAKITSVADGQNATRRTGRERRREKETRAALRALHDPAGIQRRRRRKRELTGLTNPRGFILIDEFQRNPTLCAMSMRSVSVSRFRPSSATPVPTGAPKTGFMIESMVTATTHNIQSAIAGKPPQQRATWNAVCLADFGDSGVAFVALPQIPPRNTNWASRGKWVHYAKIAYEKYFMHKVRAAKTEPYFERTVLKMVGATRLKDIVR